MGAEKPLISVGSKARRETIKSSGFGHRLKDLLQQKQLTLTQVAKSLGISMPSVHRWTNGGESEYANLRALAALLDVNWVWLRYGDEAIQDLQEILEPESGERDLRQKYLGQIIDSEARMKLAYDVAHKLTGDSLAQLPLASLFDDATGEALRDHMQSAEARGTLNITGRVRRASGPGPEVQVQVVSHGKGMRGVFRTSVLVSETHRAG